VKLVLHEGEAITVALDGAYGEFTVDFAQSEPNRLSVTTDIPDVYGRSGTLYMEEWDNSYQGQGEALPERVPFYAPNDTFHPLTNEDDRLSWIVQQFGARLLEVEAGIDAASSQLRDPKRFAVDPATIKDLGHSAYKLRHLLTQVGATAHFLRAGRNWDKAVSGDAPDEISKRIDRAVVAERFRCARIVNESINEANVTPKDTTAILALQQVLRGIERSGFLQGIVDKLTGKANPIDEAVAAERARIISILETVESGSTGASVNEATAARKFIQLIKETA
jgi:hypothetical protein